MPRPLRLCVRHYPERDRRPTHDQRRWVYYESEEG